MRNPISQPSALLTVSLSLTVPCSAACADGAMALLPTNNKAIPNVISGRASVLDGHTLWFPREAIKVRLVGIDSCDLVQWAFDPTRFDMGHDLKPVPCGALAKAWLKRLVGINRVKCLMMGADADGVFRAMCSAQGRDLAVGMLRAGWAKLSSGARSHYVKWQRHAIAARYGMWATYVLDMEEWRAKAVDRSLARLPVADINLMRERKREISPPFADAQRRPIRIDR